MKLIETASRWGNLYKFRHYIDGVRVSHLTFSRTYRDAHFTLEDGVMDNTSYGFRKVWDTNTVRQADLAKWMKFNPQDLYTYEIREAV